MFILHLCRDRHQHYQLHNAIFTDTRWYSPTNVSIHWGLPRWIHSLGGEYHFGICKNCIVWRFYCMAKTSLCRSSLVPTNALITQRFQNPQLLYLQCLPKYSLATFWYNNLVLKVSRFSEPNKTDIWWKVNAAPCHFCLIKYSSQNVIVWCHFFPGRSLAEMHVALLQNVNKEKYQPMSNKDFSDITDSP